MNYDQNFYSYHFYMNKDYTYFFNFVFIYFIIYLYGLMIMIHRLHHLNYIQLFLKVN